MITTLSNFYAERIEPCSFWLRRKKRLSRFGFDSLDDLSQANLSLHDTCNSGRLCQPLVHLYRRYFGRYCHHRPDGGMYRMGGTAAILSLDEFADFEAYEKEIKKRSNFFARKARKAATAGYCVDFFNRANQTPDILDIRKSLKFRAFGPVLDAFLLNLNNLGGAPKKLRAATTINCPKHWEICLGVFRAQPGHCQGEIVINQQLVGYVRLHRCGNVVRYADFMGHGNHLPHGVMMQLQMEIIRTLKDGVDPAFTGIRYISYGAIEQGREGLLFWKRKALFQPMLINL